jgi:hypothetical protein
MVKCSPKTPLSATYSIGLDDSPVATLTTSFQQTSSISLEHLWPPNPVEPIETLAYEIAMFRGLRNVTIDLKRSGQRAAWLMQNARTEALVLSARSLSHIFLDIGTHEDDIKLTKILAKSPIASERRRPLDAAVARLRRAYGESDNISSIRVTFDKFVLHPTRRRGAYGSYDVSVAALAPIFEEIVALVEDITGHSFAP